MRAFVFVFVVSLPLACSSAGPAPSSNPDASPSSDASSPSAGPSPASVQIAASCPSFTPCGGAVDGTWDYTGGCAELDFSGMQQGCPGLTISNTSATVQARVVFGGGQVARTYTATGNAKVAVPATCAQPAGGCTVLQAEIQSGGMSAACQDDGSGGCNCDVTSTSSDSASTTYTIDGDTVVTGDGNRYDYCVQGGTMQYTHSSGSSPEHGSFTLTER